MTRRLELDAGNSRIKWRIGSGAGARHGVLTPGRAADVVALARGEGAQAVDVATVRGAAFEAGLTAALRAAGLPVRFARAAAAFDGLVSGYDAPERLGVDRWLALIGGWSLLRRDFVCVDAGTALTVDIVAAGGQHLGGYILPGIGLMRASLFRGTEAVKVEPAMVESLAPGTATEAAVNHGLVRAAVALIESVRRDTSVSPALAPVVLAGGDHALVAAHLAAPVTCVPDLVLDGLRQVLRPTGVAG